MSNWGDLVKATSDRWRTSVPDMIFNDYIVGIFADMAANEPVHGKPWRTRKGDWIDLGRQVAEQILRFDSPSDTALLGELGPHLRNAVQTLIESAGDIKLADEYLEGWTGTAATACGTYVAKVETSSEQLSRIIDALRITMEAYAKVVEGMQNDLGELLDKSSQSIQEENATDVNLGSAVVSAIDTVMSGGRSVGAAIVKEVLKSVAGSAADGTITLDGDAEGKCRALVNHLESLHRDVVNQVTPITESLSAIAKELDEAKIPAAVSKPPIDVEAAFDPSSMMPLLEDYREKIDVESVSTKPLGSENG